MKRFAFKRHFVILGVCILALGVIVPIATFAASPKKTTSPTQTITLSISSLAQWTDTGIDLTQGSSVSITASGTVIVSADLPSQTPAGDSSCIPSVNYPGRPFPALNLPCWSLIGRIDNGTPFEVGASNGFSVAIAGRLFLGINDYHTGDNNGSWTANVTVTPPSPLVTFTKSATPTVAPGGTINYTLTLTNITSSGSGNLHDIHLNDTPSAQTSGTFTAPTFTITPPSSATVNCALSTTTSISCAVDDFAPGSVVTVSFSTTASSTATGTITNTATATTFSGNINETATANTTISVPTKLCFVAGVGLSIFPCFFSDKMKKEAADIAIEKLIDAIPFMGCVKAAQPPPFPPSIPAIATSSRTSVNAVVGSELDLFSCNADLLKETGSLSKWLTYAELADLPLFLFIAQDPTRQDFTIIAKDIVPNLQRVIPQGKFSQNDADEVNEFISNVAQEIGLERAMVVSIERAQGAAAAGNARWSAIQSQTSGKFAAQLASLLMNDSELRHDVELALKDAGVPDTIITAKEVSDFQSQVAAKGLQPGVTAALTQMLANTTILQQITNLVTGLDPKVAAGGVVERLDRPALDNTTSQMIQALNNFAQSTHPGCEIDQDGDCDGN